MVWGPWCVKVNRSWRNDIIRYGILYQPLVVNRSMSGRPRRRLKRRSSVSEPGNLRDDIHQIGSPPSLLPSTALTTPPLPHARPALTSPHSTPPISRITPRPQQDRHMIPLAAPPSDKKPDLHLRPKRPPLPKIRARVEPQTPHHLRLAALVLGQILEDLVQRRSSLRAPGCDAAVGVGEGGEGRGGPRGLRRVRETGRFRAGWPVDVSRTWQVMGSFRGVVVAARMDCIFQFNLDDVEG